MTDRGARIRALFERAARVIANVPNDPRLAYLKALVSVSLTIDDASLSAMLDDDTCIELAAQIDEVEETKVGKIAHERQRRSN
jgi:hypothetical protein